MEARRKQSERSLGKNLARMREKTMEKYDRDRVLEDQMKLKYLETLPIRIMRSG